MSQQFLADSTSNVKYKIITEGGEVLAIEQSKLLADMFVSKLTEEQKKKCIIVPITEDNKEVLLG
jgi:hypothetical protein